MYEIEKNIPRGRHPNAKYPFKQMDVGDSFLCDNNRVRAAAAVAGQTLGKRFSVSKVGDGQFRVWRIK